MAPARLRVAVAGAGMVSAHHLAAWRNCADAEVVAIADPDHARAEGRAREFNIAAVFTDADDMLARTRPEAIDIVAPPEVHGALCRIAMARGVQILCQKPLSRDFAEAEAIVSEVGSRVRFMVHENWRFRPYYRAARRWIDDGRVGEPMQLRIDTRCAGVIANDEGIAPALVRQPFLATLQRFIIGEVLIHHLDVARWLMGDLAVLAARTGRASPLVTGEDAATILLRGAGGRSAIVEGNMAAAGFPPVLRDSLDIRGTEGAILFDGERLRLLGPRPEERVFEHAAAYQAAYDGTIAHFVTALRAGTPFETEAPDNLAVLRLVEDAYRSAAAVPSG